MHLHGWYDAVMPNVTIYISKKQATWLQAQDKHAAGDALRRWIKRQMAVQARMIEERGPLNGREAQER